MKYDLCGPKLSREGPRRSQGHQVLMALPQDVFFNYAVKLACAMDSEGHPSVKRLSLVMCKVKPRQLKLCAQGTH